MGEIVNIRCDSCHTGWECRTGSGLMHGSLDSVAGIFSPKQQTEIALSAKQDPLSLFTFSFRPARCSRCHGIVSIPVLTLTESDSTFIGPCPACGQKIKPIARLSKSACPVCSNISLKSDTIGRWD